MSEERASDVIKVSERVVPASKCDLANYLSTHPELLIFTLLPERLVMIIMAEHVRARDEADEAAVIIDNMQPPGRPLE